MNLAWKPQNPNFNSTTLILSYFSVGWTSYFSTALELRRIEKRGNPVLIQTLDFSVEFYASAYFVVL